jgi:hypothetical protein
MFYCAEFILISLGGIFIELYTKISIELSIMRGLIFCGKFFWRLPLFWACLFFAGECEGQESAADSDAYQSALSGVISAYHQAIGDQAAIYNGPRYPGYVFQFRSGSPFFNSGKTDTGWVYYDSVLYKDLPLYFDDLSQAVIIDDNGYKIALHNQKLYEFAIGAHHFIRLEKRDRNWGDLDPGFYELLYQGGISVLKKTAKRMVDDLSGGESAEKSITASDHFFIEKDSVVYSVDDAKELGAVLRSKKNELLRFVKQHTLNFRKDPENALLQLGPYYDQLTGQQNNNQNDDRRKKL